MGSRTLILTYYNLLRMSRVRLLVLAVSAVPVISIVFARLSEGDKLFPWLYGGVFVLAAALVVWTRHRLDRTSGLTGALLCTPLTQRQLLWSGLITGLVLVVLQMVLFAVLIAILPGGVR